MRGKRGAMEMSFGTIVVIVLSVSVLILGLVLIKNIFGGASDNVLQMNDKVRDQIGALFVEDKRTVVYLSNQIAEIKQNEDWGVAFGIKNLVKGEATASQFHYEVSVSDPDVVQKCGIGADDIESWIKTGRADDLSLGSGESYFGITRFAIPEGAPLCTFRLHLDVTKDGAYYATDFFDIEVLA